MPGPCLLPHSVPWCFPQGPAHSRCLSMPFPLCTAPPPPAEAELCAPSFTLLSHLVHKGQLVLAWPFSVGRKLLYIPCLMLTQAGLM